MSKWVLCPWSYRGHNCAKERGHPSPHLVEIEAAPPLDEAWARAEAALPDGWRIGELKSTAYRGDGERWLVMAWEFGDDPDYRVFESAYGNTPIEALRELARALTAAQTSTPEPVVAM